MPTQITVHYQRKQNLGRYSSVDVLVGLEHEVVAELSEQDLLARIHSLMEICKGEVKVQVLGALGRGDASTPLEKAQLTPSGEEFSRVEISEKPRREDDSPSDLPQAAKQVAVGKKKQTGAVHTSTWPGRAAQTTEADDFDLFFAGAGTGG